MNSIFQYNNNPITFKRQDGCLYVNATEMARAFGKRPAKWLELPSTKEFIRYLSNVRKSDILIDEKSEASEIQSVITTPGNGGGTWMHEDVALEFARWLSPAFAIWCNDRIKDLLKNGYTKLDSISRKDLARMLLEAEEEKERILEENKRQQQVLKEAEPKVLFADAVTASETSILVGELAKILRQNGITIGQNRLFRWLRDHNYLCRNGERYNQPTQYSMELGLFEIKKTVINQPNGASFVNVTTKVSPKGQMYFVQKFLKAS